MYQRNIGKRIIEALSDTSVVLINGARQTGKSTLVKTLVDSNYPAKYITLDNVIALSAAMSDPIHFLAQEKSPLIIDEIQRAPQLLLAIKETVDQERMPGRFLLTGSANILMLPTVSDSLAGRMEIINLWPLSQGEISGIKENFIDVLFSEQVKFSPSKTLQRDKIIEIILRGGYPEILKRNSSQRKHAWYSSYLTAILQRDVRDIAHIEGLLQVPKLFALLAARVGSLLNYADISRDSGIPYTTLMRYMTLLQTIFLVQLVPAWSNNQGNRIIKAPKIYLSDTGLAADLLGITSSRSERVQALMGKLLENFVVMELKKQMGWNDMPVQLYHYRTTAGQEVDVVLENGAGDCVGIEIKLSNMVSEHDFRGLKYFSEQIGARFVKGVVLYTGDKVHAFGKSHYAVPVLCLWGNN